MFLIRIQTTKQIFFCFHPLNSLRQPIQILTFLESFRKNSKHCVQSIYIFERQIFFMNFEAHQV